MESKPVSKHLFSLIVAVVIIGSLVFIASQMNERDAMNFLPLALAIVFGIAIFLAIRSIILWYFKIDKHISNQETIIRNQERIIERLSQKE